MMLSTIAAPQLVLPLCSSGLRWKCRQLELHPGYSAHPFGTAWPVQSWAGTGSSAGTAPSLCQIVRMLFTFISLAIFTKEKAKFIHTGECDQQQTLEMTKPSLVSTNIMGFPTNTPKHGLFQLQNMSAGQEHPIPPLHAPATKWFSVHC